MDRTAWEGRSYRGRAGARGARCIVSLRIIRTGLKTGHYKG